MKLECIHSAKEYVRTIEGMGEGLVLFKTSVVNKRIGQNFHLFFEDKRKPPLDIAINPDSGIVEYISYFLQDEKIVEREIINKIDYNDGLVTIKEDSFDEKSTSLIFKKNFEIFMSNNDIFVLYEAILNKPLQAYKIGNANYLLFSNNYDFCGMLLRNISEKELKEIRNSQCL